MVLLGSQMLAVGFVSIRVIGMQQNKVKGIVCVDQGKVPNVNPSVGSLTA